MQQDDYVQGGSRVNELESWFGPLDAHLGGDGRREASVGPGRPEAELLLEMGKLAAEAAPQRLFALLTAFAVGRALGRAAGGSSRRRRSRAPLRHRGCGT